MNVYVVGVATHPAQSAIRDRRLEEMAFHTARAALKDAGVTRNDLDCVTLAASDELDARGISSMLLAAPSGAYLKDELRVTDSGMMGLVMGALRVAGGRFHLGLVIAWNQTSVLPLEAVMSTRAEPFFLRPVGLNMAVADGLFAGAVRERYGFSDESVAARVHERSIAARRNPRSVARAVPSVEDVTRSAYIAWPLRAQHRAAITDGAVAMVLASQRWLDDHPDAIPRARIAGMAWAVDSYRLNRERLSGMAVLRDCYADAKARAGWRADERPDVVELEAQNGYYDVAFTRALGLDGHAGVSPSGGAWAQNPYFCTGLVDAAEAVDAGCRARRAASGRRQRDERSPTARMVSRSRPCRGSHRRRRPMTPQAVAVVGFGQTPFRARHDDRTYVELVQDASRLALARRGRRPGRCRRRRVLDGADALHGRGRLRQMGRGLELRSRQAVHARSHRRRNRRLRVTCGLRTRRVGRIRHGARRRRRPH